MCRGLFLPIFMFNVVIVIVYFIVFSVGIEGSVLIFNFIQNYPYSLN